MITLKKINKTFEVKQFIRFIGGAGFMGIGLYLMCDYFDHHGWSECQRFIHRYYPEEYATITEKVIREVNKH